ncbi:uncharacterized protein FIBRA_07884 [Fibroporia radiculosa]|uniref:KOW domain-containing protein n=1 Tax=Fibroporia radiculosa TaxID=599839 RepID=J4H4V6_9APHY|nr:uncharacterized protein FIBRA_07884 [Fibroporia radiculosa]CCM05654.1 predicted protein [Fibroporia radiculosa]
MSLTKAQVRNAFASFGFTRDFKHLQPIPRWWKRRDPYTEKPIHFTKPKDRIKYWNIVPGDQVRLLGDPAGTIYQVNMVNKLSNRVMLKTETDSNTSGETDSLKTGKNVPYSRCQLFVGRFEFPPTGDSTEPQTLPVFAKRLATSEPFWDVTRHRFEWSRFAVNTVPRLPHLTIGEKERVYVPWPQTDRPPKVDPTAYDTHADAVAEVTYTPPDLPTYVHSSQPVPVPPPEDKYITAIRRPDEASYDPSQPVEIYLSKELANPHSRAKKQARWQAHQMYKRDLLKKFIEAEMKNLHGRTRREARAEATWKCRHQLEEDRKTELKRRWKNRGAEARLLRKKARKVRKATKQKERLRTLVLKDEPNQFIPQPQAA